MVLHLMRMNRPLLYDTQRAEGSSSRDGGSSGFLRAREGRLKSLGLVREILSPSAQANSAVWD
jgi:hypothetical protein